MQEFFIGLISGHELLAPVIFIFIRAFSVIFPPILGFTVDAPGLFIFGWFFGLIYAEIGIMAGGSIAFILARRFGRRFVQKIAFFKKIERIEKKLSENQRFWVWVAVRLPSNPIFDYISYAAGLTNISFTKFFLTTFLGSLPSMFLFYYLGGRALKGGVFYVLFLTVGLLILAIALRKTKISPFGDIFKDKS